jgi:hypothetical protein
MHLLLGDVFAANSSVTTDLFAATQEQVLSVTSEYADFSTVATAAVNSILHLYLNSGTKTFTYTHFE